VVLTSSVPASVPAACQPAGPGSRRVLWAASAARAVRGWRHLRGACVEHRPLCCGHTPTVQQEHLPTIPTHAGTTGGSGALAGGAGAGLALLVPGRWRDRRRTGDRGEVARAGGGARV